MKINNEWLFLVSSSSFLLLEIGYCGLRSARKGRRINSLWDRLLAKIATHRDYSEEHALNPIDLYVNRHGRPKRATSIINPFNSNQKRNLKYVMVCSNTDSGRTIVMLSVCFSFFKPDAPREISSPFLLFLKRS